MFVNTTRSSKLKVSFDFSFPEISCNLLSIDAVDETGVSQKDAVHEIYKHRLSPQGEKLGFPEPQTLGETIRTEDELLVVARKKNETRANECGNCYGAGLHGECCNSCDDVKRAYERIGWRFHPQGIKQCQSETSAESAKDELASDGGCQVYGLLELNKASGHFHIAPHKILQENGDKSGLIDFLELISFAFSQFNITHTVNSLSFGDHFPGISSPLDGQARTIDDTHGMYQYYLKIVPTVYRDLSGKEIESNQYAVTEHMRHLAPGSGRGLPGVYFYYELSPIQAMFEEKRGKGGLLRFLTSVCAIVGGSFTLFGFVDSIISWVLRRISKPLL